MMKEFIIFLFVSVTFMHHSVSFLAKDAQSEADECFIAQCRSTFLGRLSHNPLCGSDEQPYIHHFSFSCAKECAEIYGLELTVKHEGYCKGKPSGPKYWKDRMKF